MGIDFQDEVRENKEFKKRKDARALVKTESDKDMSPEYIALLDDENDGIARLEILLLELIRITKDKAK